MLTHAIFWAIWYTHNFIAIKGSNNKKNKEKEAK